MISLDRLLDGLDVAIEPFLVHDVRRGWSMDWGPRNAPSVHYTLSGSGILELAGGATVRCTPHSVAILPPTLQVRTFVDGGPRGTVTTRARDRQDPDVLVASARIRATYHGSVGIFDHLREPLVESLGDDDPIRHAFEELLDEIVAQRPGSRAMAEALLRRSLILFLRRHCCDEQQLSWLGPLDDTRLGRAVTAMQERPAHAFTVPELAEVAGMSRSVFAARFADALGQSPIEFLKTLRLTRAAQLLTSTDLPVKTVATRVGYLSRSSFTRAFLASRGVGPTAFRTSGREPLRSGQAPQAPGAEVA